MFKNIFFIFLLSSAAISAFSAEIIKGKISIPLQGIYSGLWEGHNRKMEYCRNEIKERCFPIEKIQIGGVISDLTAQSKFNGSQKPIDIERYSGALFNGHLILKNYNPETGVFQYQMIVDDEFTFYNPKRLMVDGDSIKRKARLKYLDAENPLKIIGKIIYSSSRKDLLIESYGDNKYTFVQKGSELAIKSNVSIPVVVEISEA